MQQGVVHQEIRSGRDYTRCCRIAEGLHGIPGNPGENLLYKPNKLIAEITEVE
jgi:hypothetical protein